MPTPRGALVTGRTTGSGGACALNSAHGRPIAEDLPAIAAPTLVVDYPADASVPVTALSRRETEVVKLVADGLRNADIAERLSISPATVTRRISSVLDKTGLSNRTALARWATEQRLVERS